MKRVALVLAILLLAWAAPLHAELSAQGNGKVFFQPAKTGAWGLVRHGVDPRWVLNPDGDRRGDGVPSFGINPVSGEPEAVWARFAGTYEIVFSRFDGEQWTRPATVSGGFTGNDISPVLVHDARGDRVVVWSRSETTAQVYLSASPVADAAFLPPARLSREGLPARSPSVVVDGLLAYVAFEEQRDEDRFVLVTAAELSRVSPAGPVKGGGPGINPFVVGEAQVMDEGGAGPEPPTERGIGSPDPWWQPGSSPPEQDPLDPVGPSAPRIHGEEGTVWVDWIAGKTIGFAEILGYALSETRYVDIPGDNVDVARRTVQRIITGR